MIPLAKISPQALANEMIDECSKTGLLGPPAILYERITHYAQTGDDSGLLLFDGTKSKRKIPIFTEVALIFVLLLRRPFDLHPVTLDTLEPSHPIAVVLLAAHARTRLAENHPLRLRDLAILASVDPSAVRKAIASGALRSTPHPPRSGGHQIKAKDARKWLSQRGVPGFT